MSGRCALPELSRRPYLLRAILDWIVDCGHTPHLIVDASDEVVQVPRQFVKEGRIVLNISASATQAFRIGPDFVEFQARFGGMANQIRVPVGFVLGIYARETGQGMVFGEGVEPDSTPPMGPTPEPPKDSPPPRDTRPKLKVVK
jgi:stringent starvation protein B